MWMDANESFQYVNGLKFRWNFNGDLAPSSLLKLKILTYVFAPCSELCGVEL